MTRLTKRQLQEIWYDRSHVPGPEGHDKILAELLRLREGLVEQELVAQFLASFGGGSLIGRASLPVYAGIRHLETHAIDPHPSGMYCRVCGEYDTSDVDVRTISGVNAGRHEGGSPYSGICFAYASLRLHAETPPPTPSDVEVRAGLDIIRTFLGGLGKVVNDDLTFSKYLKLCKKDIPGRNQDDRGIFLEMLGVLGILQPPDHPSYRTQWVSALDCNTRHIFRSDVRYPVQHWRTSHGYSEDAVEDWFGEWM